MKVFKIKGATALLYSIFSLSVFLTSCQLQEETEQPEPIEQPGIEPQPENPSECITKASSDNGTIIPGQYVVKYKSENEGFSVSSSEDPIAVLRKHNVPEHAMKKIYEGQLKIVAARLNNSQVENLRREPSIEAIEPDRIVSIVSCYTEINEQSVPWGVTRVGYGDASAKTAWIIDTGIDLDHPDLNVDINRSKSFIEGSTPNDEHGHGTHVAGTIGARNNYKGVVGVASNAKVVALKVMDGGGKGSMSNVIAAVNHVALYGKAGDVVNMSIGGESSKILDQAVTSAANKGILFSVAAGNYSTTAIGSSPARVNHPNVFTISAMDDQDTWASFSNYGNDCVDFCAPGVNINSTHKDGGYANMSGTSMATPHVAGLLLLKGKNILTSGFVKNDPDGTPDPIAHK